MWFGHSFWPFRDNYTKHTVICCLLVLTKVNDNRCRKNFGFDFDLTMTRLRLKIIIGILKLEQHLVFKTVDKKFITWSHQSPAE